MIDKSLFFKNVRHSLFGGRLTEKQVLGLEAILDYWNKHYSHLLLSMLAYILATAYHETGRAMQPIDEGGKGQGHEYGKPVNGRVYYGRGLVQITWLRNYQYWARRLGVDFVTNPDLVKCMDYAVIILVDGMLLGTFTGKRLGAYFPENGRADFTGARFVVNGKRKKTDLYADKAELISGYAILFLQALQAASVPDEAAPPPDAGQVSTVVTDEGESLVMYENPVAAQVDPEYLAWKREKEAREYMEANSKPLLASSVTGYVVAGLSSFLLVRFGLDIPPEFKSLLELVIVNIMGAGAVWGRKKATSLIKGVFFKQEVVNE